MSRDRQSWETLCVTDDFPEEIPVSAAELDALEAFLMPLVKALMSDSEAPQSASK